jgi:uncharacterized membrane protein YfcA
MSRNEAGANRARILRLGACLAILGAIGYLTGLLWHRDLPDETIEIALNLWLGLLGVLMWRNAESAVAQRS